MLAYEHSSLQAIHNQAERELAAFLRVATVVLGQSDAEAADSWLQTLESLDWPTGDYGRFFRRVTIMAIRQLQISGRGQHQPSFDLDNGWKGSRYGNMSH